MWLDTCFFFTVRARAHTLQPIFCCTLNISEINELFNSISIVFIFGRRWKVVRIKREQKYLNLVPLNHQHSPQKPCLLSCWTNTYSLSLLSVFSRAWMKPIQSQFQVRKDLLPIPELFIYCLLITTHRTQSWQISQLWVRESLVIYSR